MIDDAELYCAVEGTDVPLKPKAERQEAKCEYCHAPLVSIMGDRFQFACGGSAPGPSVNMPIPYMVICGNPFNNWYRKVAGL